jgi:hypothetical protein
MPPLKELYAFIAEGPDGNEGIASIKVTEEAWLPLVAQTKEEIEAYRPIAAKLAETLKKPVLLSRFTAREDLDTIQ